jgi:hypothetical protein
MTDVFPLSVARVALLACLLTVSGTSPADQRVAAPNRAQAKPFVVSSLNSTVFAFVAELKGEFTVTNDSVLVDVSAGELVLRDSLQGYNGPRVFGGIVLLFARQRGTPGGWTLDGPGSVPAGFNVSLSPGQQMPLPPMHFALPRPRDRALDSLWLVFQLRGVIPPREGNATRPGTAYIHFSRDIFAGSND